MKVLFKLSLVGLYIKLAYFALTGSGLIDQFNNITKTWNF